MTTKHSRCVKAKIQKIGALCYILPWLFVPEEEEEFEPEPRGMMEGKKKS